MNKSTYYKFGSALSTSAMVVTAVVPVAAQTQEAAQEFSYSDVPKGYAHYNNIVEAHSLRILTGYDDGKFKPYQPLM